MALYLVEFEPGVADRDDLQLTFDNLANLSRQSGGELIELQVGSDLKRVYAVVEHGDQSTLSAALRDGGVDAADVAEVRLVGTTLDVVKATRGNANYLVEWDFPADLTMDVYLARKKAKAPLYANVPEVQFLRTYVREDMAKCLCFYNAPDEDAVCRAREAVSTPINRLTRLAGADDGAS
ncbi:MAG TPA: DUF4242 domain-containing protein [Chloroflexota bacterium]|nr:DUF4242 domain-containing protein [Chloroflexota bacterium]